MYLVNLTYKTLLFRHCHFDSLLIPFLGQNDSPITLSVAIVFKGSRRRSSIVRTSSERGSKNIKHEGVNHYQGMFRWKVVTNSNVLVALVSTSVSGLVAKFEQTSD